MFFWDIAPLTKGIDVLMFQEKFISPDMLFNEQEFPYSSMFQCHLGSTPAKSDQPAASYGWLVPLGQTFNTLSPCLSFSDCNKKLSIPALSHVAPTLSQVRPSPNVSVNMPPFNVHMSPPNPPNVGVPTSPPTPSIVPVNMSPLNVHISPPNPHVLVSTSPPTALNVSVSSSSNVSCFDPHDMSLSTDQTTQPPSAPNPIEFINPMPSDVDLATKN